MTQVFISYSRKDLSFVEQLVSDLKMQGFDVWYDVSGISGGTKWRIEIELAIRNSQFVIIVLSPDSIASEWVDREFLFASKQKLKIIPLMYRSCELTLNYLDLNYIDVQGDSYQGNFPGILRALSINAQNVPISRIKVLTLSAIWGNKYLISVVVLMAILLGSFSLWRLNGKQVLFEPTTIQSVYNSVVTATLSRTVPPPTSTITLTATPKSTATKEHGFIIMEPQDVLNIAPTLQTFGQLAVEKYSIDERNKVNNTLRFTINSTTNTPILWRWFWCAVNNKVLTQNMTKISIIFDADSHVIPEEQLATVIFENSDPVYKGWKCRTYETVLQEWKPGTYKITQTTTISSAINDGRDTFEAGYKIYEYTVNITPK